MLRLTMRDGEVFEGETHLDLVRTMKGASMFSDAKDVLHYMAAVHDRLKEVEGVELALAGEKLDDRCESFVRERDRLGLAKLQATSGEDLDYTVKMIRLVADTLNAGDLPGAWAFLRERLRLTPDERDEVERRLGLAAEKEE
jgi:hypothetical protein